MSKKKIKLTDKDIDRIKLIETLREEMKSTNKVN